jgi:hypothetical protein
MPMIEVYADCTLFPKMSRLGGFRREQNRNSRGWSLRRTDVCK